MENDPSSPAPEPESVLILDFLTAGEKFGDFQVMQCLSFGLMGGYYRMQHIREFHEVCVFVIPRKAGEEPGFEQRFDEWAAKLQKFEHPNAVKVIGTGRIKERFCLFTELVEGVNLGDYLQEYARQTLAAAGAEAPAEAPATPAEGEEIEQGTLVDQQFGLPAAVVKGILLQVTDAVRAAHEAGIHHYGLDPTSMILTPEGQTKVFGFGLMEIFGKELFERIVSAGIPPIQVGNRKVVINTVDTLSPEVRAGGAPVVRSDFYCLGVCAYFLLTGRKPGQPPVPPSQLSASIPPNWDRIVLRCLDFEADKRPATAAVLKGEFEKVDEQAGPVQEGSVELLLKRIPIPGALDRRLNPRTRRLVRLAVLGTFAIAVMVAAVASVSVLFTSEVSRDGGVVRRVEAGQAPVLTLLVKPARAKVAFQVGDSFTVVDGRLPLVLPRGTYELTVEAPGHRTGRPSVTVGSDPTEVTVTLEPMYAWIEAKGTPGTLVKAIGPGGAETIAGTIPESGLLITRETVLVGTYVLRGELPNHRNAETKSLKFDLNKAVSVELRPEPLPATLVVRTDPPGAAVFLGQRQVGVTPLELADLLPGTENRLEVTLDRYRPHVETLKLGAGETRVVDLGSLVRKTGTVGVEVTFEGVSGSAAEALRQATRVRIAGVEGDVGSALSGVDEGESMLVVEHPDYLPYEEKTFVEDNQVVRRLVNLLPRPGRLRLDVTPQVPYVVVAGGAEAPVRDGVAEVPVGASVAVEIRARDHLVVRRVVAVRPNEAFSWSVRLQPIPDPEPGKEWTVPYVGLRMLPVDSGEVTLGSPLPEPERRPEEGPSTRARITRSFWLGALEVTQAEYQAVMGSNPSRFADPSNPVEQVSWQDAAAFAAKIDAQERAAGRVPEGYAYRLPTEAEWEYAARAGTVTPFPWGSTADSSRGNFKGRYPRLADDGTASGDDRYGTTPVGSFEGNEWGFRDMHGNVAEWMIDRFNARLPGGSVADPAGPSTGNERVVRGGGWEDPAHRCRAAARERRRPATTSASVGFRLALAPQVGG